MLKLSNKWAPELNEQPETGMGYVITSIVLKDGRRFDNATIVGGLIASVKGYDTIPFQEYDIEKIIVTHG